MKEILIYAGTAEGRELAYWLHTRQNVETYISVTTVYGAELVGEKERLHILLGPLTQEEKRDLIDAHDFCCIIDATHPYATHISESLTELAEECGLDLMRLSRASNELPEGPWTAASNVEEAADEVAKTTGNVLLCCGANELAPFVQAVPDAKERLFARVLPTVASLETALDAGIAASHLVCMQGPFSKEINVALIHEFDIACLVTKESGARGGFMEKLDAVVETDTSAIIISRPETSEGLSVEEAKRLLETRYGL